jgi:glycosyltransferase involved in cell wall biosynthesis
MSEEKNKKINVLYLHGRPSAHSLHAIFAKSITSSFSYIDEFIRWQDKKRGTVYNLFAWVLNAFFLKEKKKYNVFLIDNLHVTFVIMRMLGLINKRQKLIVHLGSHTLYFMFSGKFSNINLWLHKVALSRYDALICEGQMAEDLSKLILKKKCPPTYVTFLGPESNRLLSLKACSPNFEKNNILIIANGPTEFREFYKGLDIMLKSFELAFQSNNKIKLYILGDWDLKILNNLLNPFSKEVQKAIHFEGSQINIESYVLISALCIHCSRGDAFPTSTIEVMTAGLPTIVSEWTGTKEIVEKISPLLIVPLETSIISERILWYFNLSKEEKQKLSDKSRIAAGKFNEKDAIVHYQNTFKKICNDLQIK